jgi:hypothetical protein
MTGTEMMSVPMEAGLDMLMDQGEEACIQEEDAARIRIEGLEHYCGWAAANYLFH